MARSVKNHEHTDKRNEIVDAAQRLIYTKGYQQMTIQDILDELQISKGAFYHYFDSKGALLEALIDRMGQEAVQLIHPITHDPQLNALEKLQRFFVTAGRWKSERKDYILALVRVWYADENAIVRQKAHSSLLKTNGPMIAGIIRQGIREGVMDTPFPEQTGEIVLSMIQTLGETFVTWLLAEDLKQDDLLGIPATVQAYNDALERLLGAPQGSLQLIDAATLDEWIELMRDKIPPLPSPEGDKLAQVAREKSLQADGHQPNGKKEQPI